MTSLWPAEEVETLVACYCELICHEDKTVIRKKLDQGMWQDVARKINTLHAGKEYHLDKDGSKCADKIELFKCNFRNNKGPCPKAIKDIMHVFGAAQPDPEDGQEHVNVPTNTEINRVVSILEKLESGDMTVEKAFFEIEGARNVSFETFRKTCRDLTGGDESDDYGEFDDPAIQKLIKDCRKSLSRIQTLKQEIAVEEAYLEYCFEDALKR